MVLQAAGGKAEEQEPNQNPNCHPGETNLNSLILKRQCHGYFFQSKTILISFCVCALIVFYFIVNLFATIFKYKLCVHFSEFSCQSGF